MTLTATLTASRAARLTPPRPPRSHMDIAKTMRLPDGPLAGEQWDPATEPVQVVWITNLDNPRWRVRTLVTPSQRGKSLMGIALPMIRTMVELCQGVAYVMPNLEKLAQNWQGKVKPLIEGCGYGAWLPDVGPGSRGGKPSAIVLHNPKTQARAGIMYFMAASGGGKETSLASATAMMVAADEADDFENAGQLKLTEKRTESYGDAGRTIVVSTVNERKGRDSHPVLEHAMMGTETRLWFKCPHCSVFKPMSFDNIVYDPIDGPTAKSSARYRCGHCSTMWTEKDRKLALRTYREVHAGQSVDASGNVTGPGPMGDHYSLLANDLDFNMSSLGRIAEDEWAAKEALRERGDHSLMRLFYYKRRCEEYTADIEEMEMGAVLTWQGLLARSQKCHSFGPCLPDTDRTHESGTDYMYSRHYAPAPGEAEWTTAGIDVQQNRVYAVLVASDRQNTNWDMAWGYQYARRDHTPWDQGELHRMLDDCYLWLQRVTGDLPIAYIGVDTGDFTKDLYKWLEGKRNTPCRACKGTGENMKPVPGDIEGILWRREQLYHINSDSTRELVQASYKRPNGEKGASHIPNGLNNSPSDRAYLQHLVGEMNVYDQKTKKVKLKNTGRWDWLDARRIAYAFNRLHLQQLTRTKPRRTYGVVGKVM